MELKEIRALSAEDRVKELHELLREQFNLRMQTATGQLANTSRLGKVRREIARILTVANEKTGTAG
ncbi:MAG TPA: 50S ribosomal protein L29 [Acidiferrobacterales bacterium]|nr:50S ribosomal protein L29 [Acidiferrobacterales bacterium]